MNNKAPKIPASDSVAPDFTEFGLGGIRNPSGEFAHDLIVDSAEWIEAIKNNKNAPDTVTKNPLLVATHSMAALLDFELGRIVPIFERGCAALEEIAESLDFLAARPDGEVVPTASESERMLGILKADWLRQYPEHAESEYREALRRFEILAGL